MISTCPSCLNRVDHRDDLKEVVCECGTKFATFYEAPHEENIPFDEGTSAFAEIRDFGEALNDSAPKKDLPIAEPEPIPEPSLASVSLSAPAMTVTDTPTDCLMTAASEFPGIAIQEFLTPVSVFAELGANDPLKPAFQALSEVAARQGANGVVGVHWNLTADKVLIAGTPVKLQK